MPDLSWIAASLHLAASKSVPDLEKGLVSKLTGKEDGAARSIFAKSQPLTNPPQTSVTLTGPGTQGDYSVSLEMEVS